MKTGKVIVVGGGPAGMMAAIRAGQLKRDVTLIEKNPTLGRKLLLSGKGRCNLTNERDLDSFLSAFSKNGEFLRDAFKRFFVEDLITFFESRGLKLKTERQRRVFPASDSSRSVLEVLKRELLRTKAKLLFKCRMEDIAVENNKIRGVVLADGRTLPADAVIMATGGVSYAFTGSTGEGLAVAERHGHRVVEPRPALVGLEIRQRFPAILEGLTLKNVRLRFTDGGREAVSDMGELLFTRRGVSGPLVLSLSGMIAKWLDEKRPVKLYIDLKPALSKEAIDARLLREFEANPRKGIKKIIRGLLPARMVDLFVEASRIDPAGKASHITREDRGKLVSSLKAFCLDIASAAPIDEAMITRGGVSLKDVNPRTMESRVISGLFFAGEMLDVDADTGGFNLQSAFSTGYLAGESASVLH